MDRGCTSTFRNTLTSKWEEGRHRRAPGGVSGGGGGAASPVGVLIQKKLKPNAEYLVQGLAFVDGWDEGYFSLSGVRSRDFVSERLALPNEGSATPSQIADSIGRGFDPRFLDDERRKVV